MNIEAYRRKKLEMAYNRSLLDSPARNIDYVSAAKKQAGYRQSRRFISQDSGYNDSLKAMSPVCGETSKDSSESVTPTQECDNSENIDPTVLCSPVRDDIVWECATGCKDKRHSDLYETPRVAKKDFSLRRKLLLSKATSDGSLDLEASECSVETSQSKEVLQHVSSFEARLCNGFIESPKDAGYKPIATSTLKSELDASTSSKKWRMCFAQQRSSTIDDCKCEAVPFPEVDNLSPVKCRESPNDRVLNSEENMPEVPVTPNCNLSTPAKQDFHTPVSVLAATFHFSLCTPTPAQVSDLESSGTEDSAFHSLSFDKSQDSLTDHEGSFQELLQKHKETPKSANKSRLRKLDRCKRLSTLRERGSQSEGEEGYTETRMLSSSYKLRVARESVDEGNEFSFDDCETSSLLNVQDLTGTPALRIVRDMVARSAQKRMQQATVRDLLGSIDCSQSSEETLMRLIGRKMGLENLDLLSELKTRNLKHILAYIFNILNAESICSMWNVSKGWREMIVHDKNAYGKRNLHLKQQKAEEEQGRKLASEDAATRLQMLNRSALKSVQAQARLAFHTPTSLCGSLTPKTTSKITSNLHSGSKQQEYVKIAKTLFTDEALKPCPQCQYPAKYQPLKKRGKCSRKDCGFDFCVLCLCPFHGSKECSTGSVKRVHKNIVPGSAQSKRNLRRL